MYSYCNTTTGMRVPVRTRDRYYTGTTRHGYDVRDFDVSLTWDSGFQEVRACSIEQYVLEYVYRYGPSAFSSSTSNQTLPVAAVCFWFEESRLSAWEMRRTMCTLVDETCGRIKNTGTRVLEDKSIMKKGVNCRSGTRNRVRHRIVNFLQVKHVHQQEKTR